MTTEIESKVVTITPEVAEVMLTRNGNNRKLNDHRVTQYAVAMKRGEWKLNGETIVVTPDGTLLNGQHRLFACIEAEVPFRTVIVCGIQADAFDTIDVGAGRTVADTLTMRGIKSSASVGAGMKVVMAWELGVMHDSEKTAQVVTRTELVERTVAEKEMIEETARVATNTYMGTPGSNRPALFALHYHLSKRTNSEEGIATIDSFFEGLKTGLNLPKGAQMALRTWCLNIKLDAVRRTKEEHLGTYIRAWNHYLAGTKVTSIRGWLRTEGIATFPVPKLP